MQEPARPLVVSGEAAQRLAQRMASALGQPGPFSVQVTEEEMTSYLAREFEGQMMEQVRVWITPSGLYAKVRLRADDQHHTVRAQAMIVPDEGAVKIRLGWATYDGFRLPRVVLASVEQMANASAGDAQLPFSFEAITFDEGSLTLQGAVQ